MTTLSNLCIPAAKALLALGICRLENCHVSELQRDDDPDSDHRNGAIATALEEAAEVLEIHLGSPENYGFVLEGLHAFADYNYPIT